MINGFGVTADKVNVTFWLPEILTVLGEKLAVAVTCTVALEDPNGLPEALMEAEPTATPETDGCTAGVVPFCGMVTEVGEMVTVDGSELLSVMVVA